ncbi:STAS domain-containing protein [Mycolicibacterium vaccae]|uniref:Anti-sigma-factor antagonist n=1 Tax=Mycolicibacterium vaccae ATCC 25954 TaxID=1194972 RepID=K0VMR4_MYCVA|nr:STAS domain-containing protein [Mycolicibacterium vaccae]ANI38969.1 anti-sigma-factor antagonist [Mycolicibacterium vaccae 95051]EJZ12399.1 anti-sigma-factor antagonist [Mycolicibacterium vaccae ATCC 25954]MCV7062569.1 STAS domain-containing protein [Mycolicibacterium vaccae]
MPTPLSLHTDRQEDGSSVLTAVGELDMSNIAAFSEAVGAAVGSDGQALLVDLSAVDYLDSGAINVLFDYAESIELLVNPVLLPVLTVSGLTRVTIVKPAGG